MTCPQKHVANKLQLNYIPEKALSYSSRDGSMKSITVLFYLLAISCQLYSQKSRAYQILDNKQFIYTWYQTSMQINDSGLVLARYVVVPKIRKGLIKKISRLKKAEWMELIKDSTTDWAANLYLYALYKKDASQLIDIPDPVQYWRSCCKKADQIYWDKILPDKQEGVFRPTLTQ